MKDRFKRVIPELTDSANIQTALTGFSATIHAPIPVASATEAAQIVSGAPAEAFPVFTTEGTTVYMQESSGSGRVVVAGRRANVETDASMSVTSGVEKDVLNKSIVRSTPGWVISSDSTALTVPESGFYLVQAELLCTEAGNQAVLVSTTGDQRLRIYAGGKAAFAQNVDSARISAILTAWLNKGQTVKANYSNTAGKTTSVWGSLICIQLAS